jgi:hypothetical protein
MQGKDAIFHLQNFVGLLEFVQIFPQLARCCWGATSRAAAVGGN